MKSTLQKPILKKLIGRTNDIAILPSGKIALTFYYVTKSIIEDDGNVKEFTKQTKELILLKLNICERNVKWHKLKKLKGD
jgi:phenylacetate-CoA ligase